MSAPLQGLKILDFSSMLPGPFATMYFADLGAEVLKIESPHQPDLLRSLAPKKDGDSLAYATLNRSKKSMTLDLKKEKAREIIYKLVQDYDIVVEQFRPGVMKRLGLDYDALKKHNPKLIYASLSGFGQTGPMRKRPGHDINYMALSGCSSFTGRKSQGPLPLGVQVSDLAGGSCHLVMGVLALVVQRLKCGKGGYLDLSMTDASLGLANIYAASALEGAQAPEYEDHLLNGASIYDYYQTSDDRYLSVGSLEPKFLKSLCETINLSHLLPMLADLDKHAEVKKEIQKVIKTKSLAQWQKIFSEVDACVEPVLKFSEVKNHPQFKERAMFVEVPAFAASDGGATTSQVANPLKFSDGPLEYKFAACQAGSHNQEVLSTLGYSKEDVRLMESDHII